MPYWKYFSYLGYVTRQILRQFRSDMILSEIINYSGIMLANLNISTMQTIQPATEKLHSYSNRNKIKKKQTSKQQSALEIMGKDGTLQLKGYETFISGIGDESGTQNNIQTSRKKDTLYV